MLSVGASDREKEWAVLIECASPRPSAPHLGELLRHSLDPGVMLARAEQHGVLGLLAERLKDLNPAAPREVREYVRGWQRRQTAFALSLGAEMFRLLQHFAALGIETLVTKGPALSVRGYGDPGMRTYGDLDLVVRDKDIQRSTEAMLELGYQPRIPLRAIAAAKIPGEYAFEKSGTQLLVEFHTERTFRYHPRQLDIEKLFNRRASVAIDGRDIPALSVEDELVLISIHGAKHFWERLMWIADVAALASTGAVNWNRAMAVAREVGAERILRLALRLAADVVDAKLPSRLEAEIRSDHTVARLAKEVATRLAARNAEPMGILKRAVFRTKMRGGLLDAAAYLLRLSLSPTEEDWLPGQEIDRPWFLDVIGRPLRLARKHRRRTVT